MQHKTKIPVTVITGFLGAGKTTFINNLLQKYQGRKFALVENEFGEVAIDTKLIKGVDASQMFELKQGCICCTITDEYELVLQELAERFPDVEHLLIETTGVADPAGVIQPFFSDEQLKELYQYNGTICLVDALHYKDQPEKELTMKQLAVADLILANKSETLDKRSTADIKSELRTINPFALVDFTSFGQAEEIELDQLQEKERSVFDFVSLASSHAHIQTKTYKFDHLLSREEFMRNLEYTIDIYKREIYRVKGVLYFQNEPFEYILQGVGGSFELIEGDPYLKPGESKIVFIGKLENIRF
ncbi:CobW family GTP-binding protein [Maribellus sediminis]|uniref:CobW family GTP-binding protein n=1 Tax=Maribellus sediminis TaxID=2696285 RepID=UPI0014308643|nr:GTP-binding protein [Maribellus sediminis]